MKIIREHHGFTTNSSASSEWVDLAAKYQELALQQAEEQANAISKPAEEANPDVKLDPAEKIDTSDTLKQPSAPVVPEAPTAPPNPFVSNLTTLGLIILSVLGIFALERGVRRYMKKRKEEEDDV